VHGLRARLRGDLDTIVLKAVQAHQERRYASAGELADDVERHLEGLPILARAPSIRYRAGKFVRRHRVAAALIALACTGALTGGAWESWRSGQVDAERERARYVAEVNRARYAVEHAQTVPSVERGSSAGAISDHGVVVGHGRNKYGDARAVRWVIDASGTVTGPQELETPSYFPYLEGVEVRSVSRAHGINIHGTAVGYDELGRWARALIYQEGETRVLSSPRGHITVRAFGINDAGWVVGSAEFGGAAGIFSRGLIWFEPLNPDVQPVELPPLPGERSSAGRWISGSGVVGGYGDSGSFLVWRIGADRSVSEPTRLGTRPYALNDAAATLGLTPDNRPAYFPAGGKMLELQPLQRHATGVALGLTSPAAGQPTLIVGFSGSWGVDRDIRPATDPRAVLWAVNGDGSVEAPLELGVAEGFSASKAMDVNTHGWIIGFSENSHSEIATLWRPLEDGEGYRVIPLGSFGPGPAAALAHICEGAACSFADTSMPGSGAMTGRSWDSGAGQTSAAEEASFTYRAPGSYTVTLQVTDVSGRRDEVQVEIRCTRRLAGSVRCR
jgi:hypothetical protein